MLYYNQISFLDHVVVLESKNIQIEFTNENNIVKMVVKGR
jgi:hypothetical protein